jgi:hypothetical protein
MTSVFRCRSARKVETNSGQSLIDFFDAFFPMELLEARHWRAYAHVYGR